MDTWFHTAPYVVSAYSGYVYPNETVLPWGVLIVIYPYITGLVAGAFIVSSLYHTFRIESFKPVARLALLSAFAFLCFAPTPLLSHLGHRERAFEAIWTAHWTSAFAAFGYVASFYALLLVLDIWFAFRADIVAMAQTTKGAAGRLYRILTLGSYDVSERALGYDRKWAGVLAALGIPAAIGLHGYVGFVFGSVKSREWWSSDLMPVIFLLSAVVSGVAALVVIYVVSSKLRRTAIDENCMTGLARVMWVSLIGTMAVEVLEYMEMVYRRVEGFDMIKQLVAGPMWVSLATQALCSLVPFVILTVLLVRRVRGRALVGWMSFSAVLMMVAVLAMRWNVVIGGQELSKTLTGILIYAPSLWGREGVIWAATLFVGSFVWLWALVRLLPPWAPIPTSKKGIINARADFGETGIDPARRHEWELREGG
ncbi:MAG: polysulfide reductase NrfD [Alphaproteobacteria bacterium]|nr:polysulfide reductase NrfD [Alphaproteobacteria bacterium]MDE2630747.1 polysulfide reductase NrfD [Alphaproteobacteria bacterium]